MRQITDTILMIRPASFRMNEETAINNYFQHAIEDADVSVNDLARKEFDSFVTLLRNHGVHVIVVEDLKENDTPDALFPNNWVSFHEDGTVVLYPMFAENRRRERRADILDTLKEKGYTIDTVVDLSEYEEQNVFLEGTGSLILDRTFEKAYCALSPRADKDLFISFCEKMGFEPIMFIANQTVKGKRLAIYHTNVMMCIADNFAVICADSIDDNEERDAVLDSLKADGKEIIMITEEQMHSFAGNMLQVSNEKGERFLVMSETAKQALTKEQIEKITRYCPILAPKLSLIEKCGGGSARCMMAEVFNLKI